MIALRGFVSTCMCTYPRRFIAFPVLLKVCSCARGEFEVERKFFYLNIVFWRRTVRCAIHRVYQTNTSSAEVRQVFAVNNHKYLPLNKSRVLLCTGRVLLGLARLPLAGRTALASVAFVGMTTNQRFPTKVAWQSQCTCFIMFLVVGTFFKYEHKERKKG